VGRARDQRQHQLHPQEPLVDSARVRLLVLGLVLLTAVTPAGGAPAPDVRRGSIVFVREDPRASGPNLGVDLWILGVQGGKPARLVGDRGWDEGPAWSPDGSVVAFQKSVFDAGAPDPILRSLDIWTVRVSGRRRRNLTRDGSASSAAWSSDGRRLAFARGDGVYLIRHDGSGKLRIARRDDPGTPAWSPDGRRLAFTVPGEVRVVDLHGHGRLVARGAASGSSVSWSPDGRLIAYSGRGGAVVVPWQRGGTRLVGRGFVEAEWAPRGGTIAVVREGTAREAGIFLAAAAGGRLRRLTRGPDTQPAWSPDGRALAFRRGVLMGDIYVVDADGHGLRNLSRTLRLDERDPAWRPD
jgi:Tol biopolymer transport system component